MKALVKVAGAGLAIAIAAASARVPGRSNAAPPASCPRIVVDDGSARPARAAVLAGSMFPWAARADVVAAGPAAEVEGEYRVRVDTAGAATARIDHIELRAVDHDPGVEIVAGEDGALVALGGEGSRATPTAEPDPRGDGTHEAWTSTFARPDGTRAAIVIVASMTTFAEDAFARYLARMGEGMGPFMRWVTKEDCSVSCRREVMDDETDRLGIPLRATATSGGRILGAWSVRAIGPGPGRRIALPVDLPGGSREPVTVRLEGTRRFWKVDEVALAPRGDGPAPTRIAPRAAELVSDAGARADVTRTIASRDRDRVAFDAPFHLEVRFPPAPRGEGRERRTRTIFVAATGHYDAPIGGGPWIDACAVLSHRAGWTSLPRFAASLP
jgi:hypothetical protein